MRARIWAAAGASLGALFVAQGCAGHVTNDGQGASNGGGAGAANAGGANMSSSGATNGAAGAPCGDQVTFRLVAWQPDGGTPVDYCTDCGIALQILTLNAEAPETSEQCQTDCTDCKRAFCPPAIACVSQHLPSAGLTRSWDGHFFTPGTCNSGQACSSPQCAEKGSHWRARMCAHPSLPANPDSTECVAAAAQPCVDVPFTYPSDEPVVGVLYPTR